jgi:hypothetical protein
MRQFRLVEEKSTARERTLVLYEEETLLKRFFELQRPNVLESDRTRLLESMQRWHWLPATDFKIHMEYLDGNEQDITG